MIGVPDAQWGETILALVVLRPEPRPTQADLIEHCRSQMAHFKAPRRVEFRTELTRTATGKLQKYKLRQPYSGGPGPPGQLTGGRSGSPWSALAAPAHQ